MKRVIQAVVTIAFFAVGCYVAYAEGFQKGRIDKDQEVMRDPFFKKCVANEYSDKQSLPVQHHYEFKQHDASVFRFDLDTGEACYIQISRGDAGGGMQPCPRN
jgi:hypothetical protein